MFALKRKVLIALAGLTTTLAFNFAFAEGPSSNKEEVSGKNTAELTTNDSDSIDIKKLSEAFGHFIGRNLNAPGVNFDLENIIKGMREGAEGKPSPMSDQEYETMMAKLQERTFKQLAEKNLNAANDFIKQNAQAPSVKEIEPGKLQYLVVEEGQGATVVEHSSPLINYTGKYLDGTTFGSSADVGGPITVPLDQTIPGFSKGILGMKEGEKRRLFVHPDLGYGASGQLPPNSLLIFEVEVLKADNQDGKPNEHVTADEDLDSDDSDEDLDLG